MCHKCEPTETVESSHVVNQEPQPFSISFHSESRDYAIVGGEISQDGIYAIRGTVDLWRQRNSRSFVIRYAVSPAEIAEAYERIDRTNLQCTLAELFGIYRPTLYGCPYIPLDGDTNDKQHANNLKWFKQIARCLSDFEAGLSCPDYAVAYSMESIGNTVRDAKHQTYGKRLAKNLLDNYGCKLTTEQIETVNNLATEHSSKADSIAMEFDNDYLEGDAIDYGNSNSCWFQSGSYSASRPTFYDAGGYAFICRSRTKITRVWIAPSGHDDGTYIVFNHYGEHTLRGLAESLASTFHGKAVKVKFHNVSDSDGELYVNSSLGYLIGPADKISTYTAGDEWEPDWTIIPDEEEEQYRCHDCNCGIDRDNCQCDPNGYSICDSCYASEYCYCEACDNTVSQSDCHEVSDFQRRHSSYAISGHVCESCLESAGWQECYQCDTWADCSECTDSEHRCSDCTGPMEQCSQCDQYGDDVESHDDGECYCPECMPPSPDCMDDISTEWRGVWSQCEYADCVVEYQQHKKQITFDNGETLQFAQPEYASHTIRERMGIEDNDIPDGIMVEHFDGGIVTSIPIYTEKTSGIVLKDRFRCDFAPGSITCEQATWIHNGERNIEDTYYPEVAQTVLNLMLAGY